MRREGKGPFYCNVLVVQTKVGVEGHDYNSADVHMSRMYVGATRKEAIKKAREAGMKVIQSYEKDFNPEDPMFDFLWGITACSSSACYKIAADKYKYQTEGRPQIEMTVYISVMTQEPQPHDIRSFEVTSGALLLSDPCYNRGTWCAIYDLPATNGKWLTSIKEVDEGMWGNRIAELWAVNEAWAVNESLVETRNKQGVVLAADHSNIQEWMDGLPWVRIEGSVSVDSGQAGIFDNNIPVGARDGDVRTSFYEQVCDLTLGQDGWGVWNNQGSVSRSGDGDGGYTAVGVYEDDKLVAVKIAYYEENLPEYLREPEEDWEVTAEVEAEAAASLN